MGWRDLFKSKSERERETRREERKQKRTASRDLERSLDGLKEKIKEIRTKRDKDWEQAKEYMKSGQKAAASRLLKTCRAGEMLASKLERKAWFWEQKSINLETGVADKTLALGMQELARLNKIDPDQIDEALMDVQDVLSEQGDVDRMIDREYSKDMESLAEEEAVDMPSLEDMEKELLDEVATEIGGKSMAEGQGKEKESGKENIGQLRDRLKDLLGDDE